MQMSVFVFVLCVQCSKAGEIAKRKSFSFFFSFFFLHSMKTLYYQWSLPPTILSEILLNAQERISGVVFSFSPYRSSRRLLEIRFTLWAQQDDNSFMTSIAGLSNEGTQNRTTFHQKRQWRTQEPAGGKTPAAEDTSRTTNTDEKMYAKTTKETKKRSHFWIVLDLGSSIFFCVLWSPKVTIKSSQ